MKSYVEIIRDLREDHDKTQKEIAEYLCFSSEYHFSNFFKSKTGISPRAYRKETDLHSEQAHGNEKPI